MADPLTAEQLELLRRKIGDTNTPPAFEDDELEDLWQEANTRWGTLPATTEDEEARKQRTIWNQTIVYVFDELLVNAAKFSDYVQNETQDKKSQVFEQLRKLQALYQGRIDQAIEAGKAANQVQMVGIRLIPPKNKEKPNGECD